MKRLFYLSYDLNSLSIHSSEIIRNLIEEGIDVCLFCPDRFPFPRHIHPRCSVQRVRQGGGPYALRSFMLQVALVWNVFFRRTIGRPDLIYARQTYSCFLSCLFARLLGIPYFAEVNGIVAGRGPGAGNRLQRLKRALERLSLQLADVIIVPSHFLRDRVAERYRLPSVKIAVVPNGANETLFRPVPVNAAHPEIETGFIAVGFVGSMGLWQGVEVLKAAIQLVATRDREVRFDLVGDYTPDGDHRKMAAGGGEAQAEWGRFIARNRLSDRMTCHGFVDYEASAAYIQHCDILVAPYTLDYREFGGGSPMKLYAYLFCGKPAIVSDLGELTDAQALREQEAAYLIAPDDPGRLAEAIVALKQDPELRARLGENGRSFVLASRKWRDSAIRILEIFKHRFSSIGGGVMR
jgi:glycosyltransferase involved in cell wall biosynthesis